MDELIKIWNELLKTVQTLTSGPLIVFYLALLFRKALTQQIPALVERLVAAKFAGIELDFESLQKLAGAADPQLTQAVTVRLPQTQENVEPQAVDEAPVTKNFLPLSVSAGRGNLNQDQQQIVTALSGSDYVWRTRDRLLAVTSLTPEQLDAALTQLLQQDVVKPAFSKSHNIIFGLRERVQGHL